MSTLVSYALTSVADVKESLGIASSDLSWDNLITRKINQATRQIESYCGRRFLETTYVNEEYSATHTDQIILRQRPVTDTTPFTLSFRNTVLNEDSFNLVEPDIYFVDKNSGVLDGLFNIVGRWNNWQITYSAGYATIPEDLQEAAASLAAYFTLNADTSKIGLAEIREGTRQVRYGLRNLETTFKIIAGQLGIDDILDSYSNYQLFSDK